MQSLRAHALHVRALRNLRCVDLAPGPRFNVISGDNGQGKTSLLEAIYLVATTRSFRTSKLSDLVPTADPSSTLSVRASLGDGSSVHEQSVGIQNGQRRARIDGWKPNTLAVYAARTPVVVFSPSELGVSMGPGSERRKLLDRVALYAGVSSMGELEAYGRALRERQRALDVRGSTARDLPDWEALVVQHGLAVMAARRVAADRVAEAAQSAFARIAAPGLRARVHYAPSAPAEVEAYLEALRSSRARDAARGSASVGPHRDDLEILLDDAPARRVASQGQHRALVLALKLAEIEVVSASRLARPILLLDDVSSELDRERTAALFRLLGEQEGQVFLTTTRPDLLDDLDRIEPQTRRDFSIERGEVIGSS